jgi:hypothetical protein
MNVENNRNVIILTTPEGKLECWAGTARLCEHYGLNLKTVYFYISSKKGSFTYKDYKFKKLRVR